MKRLRAAPFASSLSLAVALLLLAPSLPVPAEDEPAPPVSESALTPEAERVLRAASDFLAAQSSFRVRIHETMEERTDLGQSIERASERLVTVRRPDRLRAEVSGDLLDREIWYNGRKAAMLDRGEGVYFLEENAPSTIDAFVDMLATRAGIVVPAAEFAMSSLYDAVIHRIDLGIEVGLSRVRSVPCRHLAFLTPQAECQLWIEEGARPLPRKMVLTYTSIPGRPQYRAEFEDWELGVEAPDSLFEFVAPEGTERVEILAEPPPGAEAAPADSKEVAR